MKIKDVYLLMKVEMDDADYSEALSLEAFRRCSVFEGRRGLLRLCLDEDFDCRLIKLM